MAKIIIETSQEDFIVDYSQGTHFFHNIVAMDVGYFSIPHYSFSTFIDWDYLKKQPIVEKTKHLKHLRCDHPLIVKMDGFNGLAAVYK